VEGVLTALKEEVAKEQEAKKAAGEGREAHIQKLAETITQVRCTAFGLCWVTMSTSFRV
jgi:hypothetical protein